LPGDVENPEISGIEYQRETLVDAESWEYLVEKLGRHCAYCGDVGLTGTTSIPRVRGGSNRVSNLVPACVPCNTATRPIEKFLAHDPELCASIKAQLKAPLKDASAVTRWPLYEALADTGLPVESSSSGRTKFNRTRLGIPKRHALDAACVGEVEAIAGWNTSTLDEGATAGLLPDQRGPVRVPSRLSHTNQARSRLPDR